MRHCRVGVQDGGRIGADSEKRCAGEIEHARIAELNIEPERRHRIQQHGDHQQKHEVIVVKNRPHRARRADGANGQGVLVLHE